MSSDTLTFLYPNDSEAHYNMDYLIDKHMPMVQSHWLRCGLTGWTVNKFSPGPEGMPPVYAFAASLVWDNKESLSEALGGGDLEAIMDEVTNFSDTKPTVLVGSTIGKSLSG